VVMASMLRNCLPAKSISLQYEDGGLMHTIPDAVLVFVGVWVLVLVCEGVLVCVGVLVFVDV